MKWPRESFWMLSEEISGAFSALCMEYHDATLMSSKMSIDEFSPELGIIFQLDNTRAS
jgi:hypothetical protein